MPEEMNTPILFLVFNRPDATAKVFAKIKSVRPKKLYIACDGPRPEKGHIEEKLVKQVQAIVENVDWECSVNTLFRDHNIGCKLAVSSAIDWVFESEESAVILEDDCLPGTSFFYFCQELLHRYAYDQRVMSISGYNPIDSYSFSHFSYFYSSLHSPWGWATWKRAWTDFRLSMDEWNIYNSSCRFLRHPSINKSRLEVWSNTYHQRNNSWFYSWDFFQTVHSGFSIVPAKNLIKNIGFNKSASNTTCYHPVHSNKEIKELNFPLLHDPIMLESYKYYKLFWRQRNSILVKIELKIRRLLELVWA